MEARSVVYLTITLANLQIINVIDRVGDRTWNLVDRLFIKAV